LCKFRINKRSKLHFSFIARVDFAKGLSSNKFFTTMKKTLPMKRKLLSNLEASINELKNMNVKVVIVGPRHNIVHMNKKAMMEIEQMEKMEKCVMKLKFKLHTHGFNCVQEYPYCIGTMMHL
jgi:soluble P-type ATPase